MDREQFESALERAQLDFGTRVASALNEFNDRLKVLLDEYTEGLAMRQHSTNTSGADEPARGRVAEVSVDDEFASIIDLNDLERAYAPSAGDVVGTALHDAATGQHVVVDLNNPSTDDWHHHHSDYEVLYHDSHASAAGPEHHAHDFDDEGDIVEYSPVCNHAGCPWGIHLQRIAHQQSIHDPATGHRHYFGAPCELTPCPLETNE
jgi:Rieske Fe-S protein